jgi:hypothetical protein
MYNSHAHRSTHPVNARLNDLLEQVRQEFDTQNGRAGEYENQRKFAHSVGFECSPAALLCIIYAFCPASGLVSFIVVCLLVKRSTHSTVLPHAQP